MMGSTTAATIPAAFAGRYQFHHTGIIVRDLARAAETYRALGFPPGDAEDVPSQGVRVLVLPTAVPGQYVEVIAPTSGGHLERYLARRGEGIHHIAFAVADIAAELGRLQAVGVRLVDSTPRVGAHGWTVAFVHPEAAHGALIELVQP